MLKFVNLIYTFFLALQSIWYWCWSGVQVAPQVSYGVFPKCLNCVCQVHNAAYTKLVQMEYDDDTVVSHCSLECTFKS